ncbi:MAG: hypothetical protein II791_02570, partial [Bacteroidales bacterium]|nr:hypothetical protein [Bacteroidales bacterium]
MEFPDFILAHNNDDPAALALKRSRYASDVEDFDLALSTLEVRRKLRLKVPEWHAVPSLRFPLRLSGEQCSSTETALYKASVVLDEGAPSSKRVADLTGGLGVDAWAFSKVASAVLYNEMNPALAAAAGHNFKALGADNIIVANHAVGDVPVSEILGSFRPDVIFLDPARRGEGGRKVFRLEDCSPDVSALMPELYDACAHILLKLSPMADITMLCTRLPGVRHVHVVEAEGECKELLLWFERGWKGGYDITVYAGGKTLTFTPEEEASAKAELVDGGFSGGLDMPGAGALFEPGKALLKSGAFKLPCARFGLRKLGVNTHLYASAHVVPELAAFGKWFTVREVLPFSGKAMKTFKGLRADVTSRGLPLTSDELRKRCGVLPGDGTVHIFGASTAHGSVLILSERITSAV